MVCKGWGLDLNLSKGIEWEINMIKLLYGICFKCIFFLCGITLSDELTVSDMYIVMLNLFIMNS